MNRKDQARLWLLGLDNNLSEQDRDLISRALNYIQTAEREKANRTWKSPYREAIALLERADRGHEGSYG